MAKTLSITAAISDDTIVNDILTHFLSWNQISIKIVDEKPLNCWKKLVYICINILIFSDDRNLV